MMDICLEKYHVYNPKAVVNVMLRWRIIRVIGQKQRSYEAVVPLINMDFDGLEGRNY